jgi:hypothetical protein
LSCLLEALTFPNLKKTNKENNANTINAIEFNEVTGF